MNPEMADSFPSFGKLPPELRHMVWSATLHDPHEPALYPWSPHWTKSYLNGPTLHSKEGDAFDNVRKTRSHDVPGPILEVEPPVIASVNQEARDIVLEWAASHNLGRISRCGMRSHTPDIETVKPGTKSRPKNHGPSNTRREVFCRPWDEQKDILFVSRNYWSEFCDLPADISEEAMTRAGTSIQHLALPAFTAYYSLPSLIDIWEHMPNLRAVYVVWGKLPNFNVTLTPGEDPLGRERMVEQLEAQQPQWRLAAEERRTIKMCIQDPLDGTDSWEEGDIDEWMEEVRELADEELLFQEDSEGSKSAQFLPVKVIR